MIHVQRSPQNFDFVRRAMNRCPHHSQFRYRRGLDGGFLDCFGLTPQPPQNLRPVLGERNAVPQVLHLRFHIRPLRSLVLLRMRSPQRFEQYCWSPRMGTRVLPHPRQEMLSGRSSGGFLVRVEARHDLHTGTGLEPRPV